MAKFRRSKTNNKYFTDIPKMVKKTDDVMEDKIELMADVPGGKWKRNLALDKESAKSVIDRRKSGQKTPVKPIIVKDKLGRFAKGTSTNPKMKNIYEDDDLFKHEKLEIDFISSAKKLSFLNRGKKYYQFKQKWELSDLLVAEYFGKERCTVSRDIRAYLRSIEYEDINLEGMPDRVALMVLDNSDIGIAKRFAENYSKYDIELNTLNKLLKGTKTSEEIIQELKEEYNHKVSEIRKFEREVLEGEQNELGNI